MRTETQTIEIYTFEEANDELKQKIKDNIITHWDIYEHCMQERIDTLEAIAKTLNARLDYSLSCVPDRGEYIKMTPKNEELDFEAFWEVINKDKYCPFTSVCYDHDIIDVFNKHTLNSHTLEEAFDNYISSIHDEYESMLSDESISEMCQANDYEFTLDGKLY